MGGSLMWEGSGWSWYPRPTPDQLEALGEARQEEEGDVRGQERADEGPGHEDETQGERP